MGKIFSNVRTQPVYYQIGKDETTGKMNYRRAPFDAVLINGAIYIQPRSIGPSDQAIVALGIGTAEDQANWQGPDMGGYETLEPIIINENQVGDGSDNWFGLTSIGNL